MSPATGILGATRASDTDAERSGFDGELLCLEAFHETHDVRTFVLEVPPGHRGEFDPGQHLTVTVEVDGVVMQRCYTISSSPTRPERITLTVKRVPDGPVSTWLHDHLGVGGRLRVSGPAGRFSTAEHPASKYLFLSAGSGITPLMSMTRAVRDQPGPADVAFVHSARTPGDIIFGDELAGLASTTDWLGLTVFCEEGGPDPSRPDEAWSGPIGRLSRDGLLAAVPDLLEREVFSCGPEPYMVALRAVLTELGVDPQRCHEESFVLAGRPATASPTDPGTPATTTDTGTGHAVEFARTGKVVRCEEGSSVLDAALRAGVNLPSSCGEGMCGTCITTLLHGDVDMQHAGGIRPREIKESKILPCCSVPLGDLVLDA